MDRGFWPWLAGAWEGEGTFHLKERKRNPNQMQSYFSVAQSGDDRKAGLDYIKAQTGVGKVYPRHEIRPNRKPAYVWELWRRTDILRIVPKLIPYLRFRRKEVEEKLTRLKEAYEKQRFHFWTAVEEDFIRANWRKLTDRQIAKALKRTYKGVMAKRQKMELDKKEYQGEEWTDEEIKTVKANLTLTDAKMAILLNNRHSPEAIKQKRSKLSLLKYPSWSRKKGEVRVYDILPHHSIKRVFFSPLMNAIGHTVQLTVVAPLL